MAFFKVEDGRITTQLDVPLQSREPFDRVRLMKEKQVDMVICGGMQALYEDLLTASDIQVVSWVSGKVEDILRLYLEGNLTTGKARLGDTPSADDESAGTYNPSLENNSPEMKSKGKDSGQDSRL
jgi:predicted Fe-Mo cluster-binding NifX family protein